LKRAHKSRNITHYLEITTFRNLNMWTSSLSFQAARLQSLQCI